MLAARPLQSICLPCTLRLYHTASRSAAESARTLPGRFLPNGKRLRLSRQYTSQPQRRNFTGASKKLDDISQDAATTAESLADAPPPYISRSPQEIEAVARRARNTFGDTLPEGHLSGEEYTVYERLYGEPTRTTPGEQLEKDLAGLARLAMEEQGSGYTLVRRGEDGEEQEVEFYSAPALAGDEGDNSGIYRMLLRRAADIEAELEVSTQQFAEMVLGEEALAEDQRILESEELPVDEEAELEEEMDSDPFSEPTTERTHPLTAAGRFATSPSTLNLPKAAFVEPVSDILANASNKHLIEVAHRTFDGVSLPFSTATPNPGGRPPEQRPIALEAAQAEMTEMQSNVYMTAVMPGTYAAVLSTLVETRKRLGSEWLESLLNKEGGPLILDAGAGGAAVIAWREVLAAEWDRMHDTRVSRGSLPLGKATVLTGSDTLRHRASRLLDSTTFLPRLPDTIRPDDHNPLQPRKLYDIIVAPHSLLSLKEDYLRKQHVQKLWSLLNPDGGVLVLIEKGMPRGFEAIAGARAMLLDNHISTPATDPYTPQSETVDGLDPAHQPLYGPPQNKEKAMIVAPCTNHAACPMYTIPGTSKGRKDFCYFSQRFIRPPFLQHILGAKDRNHEDVQFSYLSVQRGRDQRARNNLVQGVAATDAAFAGHEHSAPAANASITAEVVAAAADAEGGAFTTSPLPSSTDPISDPTALPTINTLSLPRTILQPLKRRGHVILDVCTPSGTLERWTVPKSFSKRAYRDARKAQWGDLWALGAKTRVPRPVRLGRAGAEEEGERGSRVGGGEGRVKRAGKGGLGRGKIKGNKKNIFEIGVDEDGNIDIDDLKLKNKLVMGRRKQDGRKGRKGKDGSEFDIEKMLEMGM